MQASPAKEQEWSHVKYFVVCNLFTQKDAPDSRLSASQFPKLIPPCRVVLCFSRAAEQGHPHGRTMDDGAASRAGPETGIWDVRCRMQDAGCWLNVGRGSYCWTDCHGEATFHDKSFVHAFQTLARARLKDQEHRLNCTQTNYCHI